MSRTSRPHTPALPSASRCPIVGQIWEAAARTPSPNENVEPSGCRPSSYSTTSGMPSSPEVFYGAAALVVRYVFDRMPPGLHGVPPSWRREQEAVHAAVTAPNQATCSASSIPSESECLCLARGWKRG